MNFDDMGDRIREITADILIETRMTWVDYGGHVYIGKAHDGVFNSDIYAFEILDLVRKIKLHPELSPIVVSRTLADDGEKQVVKEIYNHMLNNGQFHKVRRILQIRFIEYGKSSGIVVNPVFPDALAITTRFYDYSQILSELVEPAHAEKIEALQRSVWKVINVFDPISAEDDDDGDDDE